VRWQPSKRRCSFDPTIARYNMAQIFEETDRKRAITEYETYIALVEGYPEEEERLELVKKRVKDLKR